MSESINFSTFYRPTTFAEVVGQDIPKAVLKKIAMADGISVRSIFLKGGFGCGKCVLGATRVATSEGYLPIEGILSGNVGFNEYRTKVYTRFGMHESSHWYKEENCFVLLHKLSNGYTINGTVDHRVLSLHNNIVGLHRMGDLTVGDTILFPKVPIGYNWTHAVDLAYATGLWLGDGSIHNGVMSFCGTREMCCKFAELVGWNGALVKDKRREDLYMVRPLVNDKSLINIEGHSDTKVIPEYIFKLDVESRVAFVQGLLDTDGTIRSTGDVEWTLNSKSLIFQLQDLLLTLGVSSRVVPKVTSCSGYSGKAWRLRIPANQSSFPLTKNGRFWKHSDSSNDRNIIRVDGEFVSRLIRDHRKRFSNRHKSDVGAQLSKNVKNFNALTERSLIKYKEFYGELPFELEGLLGYNYETIVDTDWVENVTVYDLTVPAVHEFYCQGTYNHNTTLSKIFAKAMVCENFKKTGDVCNECDYCKEVSSKNSQLYLEFDSSVVGNVDKIRELHDLLSVIPTNRRVVTFDEIHAASRAAQNAMLKMVEEGMPNTVFVFCSTDDILPTIKSRSVCLDISTIPLDLIKNRVSEIAKAQNLNLSSNVLDSIALRSNGHMRDALSYLQLYSLAGEEALKSSYSLVVRFFVQVFSSNAQAAYQTLSELMKFNMVDVRNSIYIFIRNCFTATPEDKLYKFQSSGIVSKIFSFWFSPVVQSAIKDEVGLELAFRNFITKVIK